MSNMPSIFRLGRPCSGALAERLHARGLTGPEARIVVEKPFGHDLASARALNATLAAYFDETRSTGSITIWARKRCRT
jgi:glucose-6-phosphate 1-dehydrogenase